MTPRNDPTLLDDTIKLAAELEKYSPAIAWSFGQALAGIQAADSETIDYRLAEAAVRVALILVMTLSGGNPGDLRQAQLRTKIALHRVLALSGHAAVLGFNAWR